MNFVPKKFIPLLISIVVGFFTLLFFWHIPYGNMVGTGYTSMGLFFNAWTTFVSLFQILNFLVILALILVGVFGILQYFKIEVFDMEIDYLKLNYFLLIAFASLNTLVLLFIICSGSKIQFGCLFNFLVAVSTFVYFGLIYPKEEKPIPKLAKKKSTEDIKIEIEEND